MEALLFSPYTAQATGWAAALVNIWRFQMRTAVQMRHVNIVVALLFSLHYGLMGATAGMVLCFIAATRSSVLSFDFFWRRRNWVGVFYFALCTLAFIPTYHSWLDILPLIGLYCGCLIDLQHNAVRVRALALGGQCVWFTYNLLLGSYGGMFSSALNMVSNGIGYYRHHWRKFPRAPRIVP